MNRPAQISARLAVPVGTPMARRRRMDSVGTFLGTAETDLARLMLAAYGATTREQDVCFELLTGRSTTQIVCRLYISPHTVQDHLKALYEKVGVRSREELVAKLQA